jgi:aryl-alcohol dehydrogenase-like predicted oxidoreductase
MQKRRAGRSMLEVMPLCLGGNVFGWATDEQQSFAVLDAYVDGGGNFIDTANVYSRWVSGHSGGESEIIIGKWLKQRGLREKVIIATKVGGDMGEEGKGLTEKYILRAVEASLQRLQTDYIDLYQTHFDDPNTPQAETLGIYARLVEQGKVRVIGASNFSAERLTEALKISKEAAYPRYETLQPLYNLYDRAVYERDLAPICQKEEIGVIPYYSLAAGFLTGKYRAGQAMPDSVRAGGVKQKYMNERGFTIIAALDQVASNYGATPAQIALAWLMAQPTITAPIASATSVAQVQELLAATEIKLDAIALQELNQASAW